ncbi:iron-siderophore ABC transporter substrate-binding protein [Planomonospora sp. ID91781]|uniref:Griseobactin-binding lipoprotein n=1 Tax=Planomonospora sphaerica TaxID=161355 RepID=A0A161MBN3_9ACTN|nr:MULTISPECIES: iron-siderophore ABC transporter substrate-binding protein [Planomonospora]MBG0825245.1 iron-siderophore ABC transporter substrate-binding protein [Planomonospora sp. ID91781]GAT67443.1 griseobactin-binding lipoprotein [Planomonospora sphaerica]
MSPLRRAGGLFAALLAALTVAACGTPSENASTDTSAAPAASSSAASATREVKDATGTLIKVPAEPKRVVTLTQEDLDAALALGVTPVGITNGQGLDKPPAYLADKVQGIPVVGNLLQPVIDKVVEVQPDLILAGDMQDQQMLDQLRKITPATVVTMAPTDDWKLSFMGIGNTLNRLDAAKKVLADYDAKVAEAKAKVEPAEVSIVRWNPQGPSWMEKRQFASFVATDLGLTRPKAQDKDGTAHSMPLSLEALSDIDGEWLFLSTLTSDGEKALAEVKETPAFKELKAVKAGHVATVDGSVWSTRGAPLAAQVVLDDLVKALAG